MLEYRDLGMKSVNRYTDREEVSRIATFGRCQHVAPVASVAPAAPAAPVALSLDISVQAAYPYSVNHQLRDTRQSGSRRVSKSRTRTLNLEESDTLDGLLNGSSSYKSMRGKLQCVSKMANMAHPAGTRSESQLTIHLPGPFGAPPAKVLYPFLRRAFHPGPPRGTVVVVPTPLPFVLSA